MEILKHKNGSVEQTIYDVIIPIFGNDKIFVEAGGSHPIEGNMTYLFEKIGWKGLIVEPKEDFNYHYSIERPNSIVENYVLVSEKYEGSEIEADFSYYMEGGVVNTWNRDNWNPKFYKCCTLDYLMRKHNMIEIHLLSIDVEGYENEVLDGIDFDSTFVHLMVLESHEIDGICVNFDYLEEKGFSKILVIERSKSSFAHEFWMNKKSGFFKTNSSE